MWLRWKVKDEARARNKLSVLQSRNRIENLLFGIVTRIGVGWRLRVAGGVADFLCVQGSKAIATFWDKEVCRG